MSNVSDLCNLQRDLLRQVAEDNGIMFPYGETNYTNKEDELKKIAEETAYLANELIEIGEDSVVASGYTVGIVEDDAFDDIFDNDDDFADFE